MAAKGMPPYLFIHGTADSLVKITKAKPCATK
jgi:hypothetical protein